MKNLQFENIYINTTKENRILRILLPDNYETSTYDYPVLYMHDGQNLFEDNTSYSGYSWGIPEAISNIKKHKHHMDMIIVGIDNSSLRFYEYSPWESNYPIDKFNGSPVGGMGSQYAEFIVNSVIPFIESKYRVKKDSKERMIAGSSMGAYISAYIGARYPHLFGVIGVFSLASWFNENDFIEYILNSNLKPNQKFFISIGKNETSSTQILNFNDIYLNNSRTFKKALEEKGIKNIYYIETDDIHNELAWKKMFPHFLNFIQK